MGELIDQRWTLRRIAHMKEHVKNVMERGDDELTNGELALVWNMLDEMEKEERSRTRKKSKKWYWVWIALILIGLCWLLTSCAYFPKDGSYVLGSGRQKRDAQGNILEIECTSPLAFSLFGVK